MEYIHNLIWLCPLLFIAGFIDSIAGGGGLIALPAYMMCGMPIYYVYGCNKFQCAFGSTVAAWKSLKNGCLDLKITLISAVTSFLCSMLGTRIIFYLKEDQIRSMLMVLLPLTAVLVIFMKNAWNYTDTKKPLILPNVLRASNDVAFCMILSILSMWICRIGMSYVLGVRMGFGVFGVWVAMTMDWVVRAIFFVLRYRSGKWQHQT